MVVGTKSRFGGAALVFAAGALALATSARAHVTIEPDELEAGDFERVYLQVPNERPDASTTEVGFQLPRNLNAVTYEAPPGWTAEVERRSSGRSPSAAPNEERPSGQVSRIRFTAAGDAAIGPGEFRDFGLAGLVDGKPGAALKIKALQTYSDGEVVRWVGTPGSKEPAARATLVSASGAAEEPVKAREQSAEQKPAPAAGSGGDENAASKGLAIAALLVGAAGLLIGGLALGMLLRRRS